jgi:hypothetical protein
MDAWQCARLVNPVARVLQRPIMSGHEYSIGEVPSLLEGFAVTTGSNVSDPVIVGQGEVS